MAVIYVETRGVGSNTTTFLSPSAVVEATGLFEITSQCPGAVTVKA